MKTLSPLLLVIFIVPFLFGLALIFAPRWMHWINEWHDSTKLKGKNTHNINLPESPTKTRLQILQITGYLMLGFCIFLFLILYFG